MQATITKRLYGVVDGQVIPVWHEIGAVVTGELAAAAISTGHAEEIKPELAKPAGKGAAGPAGNKAAPGPSGNK